MFGTWDSLRLSVDHYISAASRSDAIIEGFCGDRSNSAVNHLITRIDNVEQLVSQRVTIQIVERHDQAFLRRLRMQSFCANPSFAGWVFEGEVLARV
jgi:hypothetical protein